MTDLDKKLNDYRNNMLIKAQMMINTVPSIYSECHSNNYNIAIFIINNMILKSNVIKSLLSTPIWMFSFKIAEYAFIEYC